MNESLGELRSCAPSGDPQPLYAAPVAVLGVAQRVDTSRGVRGD